MTEKAIVLLSGGLDSATALYWALLIKKWSCRALSFDYGQRHRREVFAAEAVARAAGVTVEKVRFSLPWGGSSLLGDKGRLPVHSPGRIGKGSIPSTYVPARNTIFLSFALSWADAMGVGNIVIGANALDFSGIPTAGRTTTTLFKKPPGSERASAPKPGGRRGFGRLSSG